MNFRLLNEPVAVTSAVRLCLYAAIQFGLDWSDAQVVALMAALEAVLGLFTRQSVVPNQLAEQRVAEGLSPTDTSRPN